jgi:hypothetical protein
LQQGIKDRRAGNEHLLHGAASLAEQQARTVFITLSSFGERQEHTTGVGITSVLRTPSAVLLASQQTILHTHCSRHATSYAQ